MRLRPTGGLLLRPEQEEEDRKRNTMLSVCECVEIKSCNRARFTVWRSIFRPADCSIGRQEAKSPKSCDRGKYFAGDVARRPQFHKLPHY